MYKCILIHRISYERSLKPTQDNFFVSEFDGSYSLMKYIEGKKNGWPYEILHDRIFNNLRECIEFTRSIMKPNYTCYFQYKNVAKFDIMDDVTCIELIMTQQ